jgi:hypothetical protein
MINNGTKKMGAILKASSFSSILQKSTLKLRIVGNISQ